MLILNQQRWPSTGHVLHFDNCQLGFRSRPNRELPSDKILSRGPVSGQTGFHYGKPIVLSLGEFASNAFERDRSMAGDRNLLRDLLVSTTNKTKKNQRADRVSHRILWARTGERTTADERRFTQMDPATSAGGE